jgi:hypothetical protein
MGSAWRVGIWILILLIGIVTGLLISKFSLCEIDPKLDFGQLLQVLITLILAVLVSKWWRDQHFRSDTAKNILTDYIRSLRATQLGLRSDFRTLISGEWDDKKYREILAAFRDSSNSVLEIETTAKAVFNHDPCHKLRTELFALKSIVTSVTPSRLRALAEFGDIETAFSKFQICLAETQAAILQL